jgi:hypothetical protein
MDKLDSEYAEMVDIKNKMKYNSNHFNELSMKL